MKQRTGTHSAALRCTPLGLTLALLLASCGQQSSTTVASGPGEPDIASTSQASAGISAMSVNGVTQQYLTRQVVVKDDKGGKLKQWLKKVGGRIIDNGDIPAPPKDMKIKHFRTVTNDYRLVEVPDVPLADTSNLKVQGLGKLSFTSQSAKNTFSAVDSAIADGLDASLNFLMSPTGAAANTEGKIDGRFFRTDEFWHLKKTPNNAGANSFEAFDRGYKGQGVQIAIIDTGFKTNDIEVQGTCWDPYILNFACGIYRNQYTYDFTANSYNLSNTPDILNWHGLRVAQTAAAALNNHLGGSGTAPLAETYLFRLSDSYTDYEAARAVNTAVAWGADVINMSFGGWRWGGVGVNGFASALQNATNAGVINVASAGNNGAYSNRNTSVNNIYVPAAWAPVIGVGAIDEAGNKSDWGPDPAGNNQSSNFGPVVTVWAGGSNISHTPTPSYGCWDQSQCLNLNYRVPFSGTSAAAPVVSGVIAVMKQVKPNLTQGEVQSILQSTGHIVNGRLVIDESAAVKEALVRNGGSW